MQVRKYMASVLLVCFNYVLAAPPDDVVKSCYNWGPASHNIKMTKLYGAFSDKPDFGCEDQLDIFVDGKKYGYGFVTCNDQSYLIIGSEKFLAAQAVNNSVDGRVKPGDGFSNAGTVFFDITKERQSYICVLTPAFETGKGAAYATFYLIKRASSSVKPEVNFYFLDEIR
ncbi:hypothetical protein [Chromobacterium sp. LK1]|uniref:hypothetical protein n=1 Tax=Chromobacterium sp. LK1 TaxID=1628193 RepID=UPI0012E319B3|nr:hypothetical protein [Chromobacterium sp. LK1]